MDAREARDEARKLLDRTISFLKDVGTPLKDGMRRTYEISALKLEMSGLRRGIDDGYRDLGRQAYELLKGQEELRAKDVVGVLSRLERLEQHVAEKERLVAELEKERADGDAVVAEAVAEAEEVASRVEVVAAATASPPKRAPRKTAPSRPKKSTSTGAKTRSPKPAAASKAAPGRTPGAGGRKGTR